MLPRKNRLYKNKDFEAVFEKGKTFFGKGLVVKVLPQDLPTSRFGFIVSKKTARKAVQRNRIRRRLREIVRREILPFLKKNIDAIIIAKQDCPDSFNELQQELKNLFSKFCNY